VFISFPVPLFVPFSLSLHPAPYHSSSNTISILITDPGWDTPEDATIIFLSDAGDVKDKDFNSALCARILSREKTRLMGMDNGDCELGIIYNVNVLGRKIF